MKLTKLIEQNQGNVFIYDETQGNNETQALSTKKESFFRCKKNRQIIIKEDGSKEEDRQEEADVIFVVVVKNGYADLKRRHQNDENQEDF